MKVQVQWSGENVRIIFVSVTFIIEILVLPQHEQFYPEGLSVFAPFSLEFYLNYKVSIEIQGLSRVFKHRLQLSRTFQALIFILKFKDFKVRAD